MENINENIGENIDENIAENKNVSEKGLYIVFGAFMVIVSIVIRYLGMEFISSDYNLFLKHWYSDIKELGGLSALSQQVGDYNVTYQIVIALFTYLDVFPLYLIKIFSIVFDYSLAVAAMFFAGEGKTGNKLYKFRALAVIAVVLIPTVFFNSAYWGQCDVIYVSFIVWALYFLRKDKFTAAFIFLGLSFAFKLQVVFILPFIVYYCWYKKKTELVKLLLIPAVGFVMSLPAVFMGRPWYTFISVYLEQSDSYKLMTMNAPNTWAIYICSYDKMKIPAILITFALLGIVLLLVMLKKIKIDNARIFAALAAWSAWTCVMFLPSMHERYFYIVDILMLLLALVAPKRYIIWFIAEELLSLCATYLRCMLFIPFDLKMLACVNMAIYLAFTVVMVLDIIKNNKGLPEGPETVQAQLE